MSADILHFCAKCKTLKFLPQVRWKIRACVREENLLNMTSVSTSCEKLCSEKAIPYWFSVTTGENLN
jgi:hypothetical protein